MAQNVAKDGDSRVQELNELLRKGKEARQPFEPDWYMNLAYFAGHQWLMWDGQKLARPQLRKDRVLLVDNRIQPAVRRSVARRTKQRPTFVCDPRTKAEEHVVAAQLAEVCMDDIWDRLFMGKRLRTALRYADIVCAGFLKGMWDSEVGEKGQVLLGPDGDILTDQYDRPVTPERFSNVLEQIHQVDPEQAQMMQSKVTTKTVAEGDVSVVVRSPWQIVVDPLAESLDEAAWIIEETVVDPDEVQARYNVELKPDSQASVGLLESRMATSTVGKLSEEKVGVRLMEMWAPPSSKNPRGKKTVWANNQQLDEQDNPHNRIPYVMLSGIEVPGRFWPTSMTETMRGPQTELNKVKSQLAENRSRVGNPALLVNRQSNFKWSGLPGERAYYDPTAPDALPKYLSAPELPAYVREEIGMIEASLSEVGGDRDVSNPNQIPPGVTAAAAINLMLEEGETMLGPDIEDQEEQVGHLGSMMLETVAEKYTTARLLRVGGEDGDWDIQDFRGAMLKGHTGVRVASGSQMPKSKAAKQAEMTNMITLFVQNGIPLKPRNLRRFFKEYDAGALERLVGDMDVDERKVHREHRLIEQGTPVEVDALVDDHDVEIEGHAEFMKSPRFARWGNMEKAFLRKHLQSHYDARDARAAEEMSRANAVAAAGAPAPVPGAPGGAPAAPAGPQAPQQPGGAGGGLEALLGGGQASQ